MLAKGMAAKMLWHKLRNVRGGQMLEKKLAKNRVIISSYQLIRHKRAHTNKHTHMRTTQKPIGGGGGKREKGKMGNGGRRGGGGLRVYTHARPHTRAHRRRV